MPVSCAFFFLYPGGRYSCGSIRHPDSCESVINRFLCCTQNAPRQLLLFFGLPMRLLGLFDEDRDSGACNIREQEYDEPHTVACYGFCERVHHIVGAGHHHTEPGECV